MPIQGNHNETFTHVVYRPGKFRQNQFDLLIGNFLKALSTAPFLEEVIETSIETLTVVRRNDCGCGSLAGKDDRSLGHHERLLVELIVLQALTAATPGWVHGFSHVGELTPIRGGFSATSAAKQRLNSSGRSEASRHNDHFCEQAVATGTETRATVCPVEITVTG